MLGLPVTHPLSHTSDPEAASSRQRCAGRSRSQYAPQSLSPVAGQTAALCSVGTTTSPTPPFESAPGSAVTSSASLLFHPDVPPDTVTVFPSGRVYVRWEPIVSSVARASS